MSFLETLKDDLIADEGYRTKPYPDTRGIITIGVGYNLEANGLPKKIIDMLFHDQVLDTMSCCEGHVKNFHSLSDNRKAALCNIAFNVGCRGFSKFKNTIKAVESGDYQLAADEILDSSAARELPNRYKAIADKMRAG